MSGIINSEKLSEELTRLFDNYTDPEIELLAKYMNQRVKENWAAAKTHDRAAEYFNSPTVKGILDKFKPKDEV